METMLIATSSDMFGRVMLSSGMFGFADGEAVLTDPVQIAEYKELVASGRAPHLGIKDVLALEQEATVAAIKAKELSHKVEMMRGLGKPTVGPETTSSGALVEVAATKK